MFKLFLRFAGFLITLFPTTLNGLEEHSHTESFSSVLFRAILHEAICDSRDSCYNSFNVINARKLATVFDNLTLTALLHDLANIVNSQLPSLSLLRPPSPSTCIE